MNEKIRDIENIDNENTNKLIWETPRLFILDKGKTEGGTRTNTYEDTYNDNAS